MGDAAVEDADETVGDGAEGLVVRLATASKLVVVAPSTLRPGK